MLFIIRLFFHSLETKISSFSSHDKNLLGSKTLIRTAALVTSHQEKKWSDSSSFSSEIQQNFTVDFSASPESILILAIRFFSHTMSRILLLIFPSIWSRHDVSQRVQFTWNRSLNGISVLLSYQNCSELEQQSLHNMHISKKGPQLSRTTIEGIFIFIQNSYNFNAKCMLHTKRRGPGERASCASKK